MPKRVTDYRQTLLASLTDSREAACYLEAALEDSKEMFLTALRDVAESRQMSKVAKEAGLAREALYRILSESGNPTLATLNSILNVLGVRLRIVPAGVQDNPATPQFAFSEVDCGNQFSTALAEVGTKRQIDQGIATHQLPNVTGGQRKPPMREVALAMSAGSLNDFSRQANTDGREHR